MSRLEPTLKRDAIYTPQPNELLLVRGQIDSRTTDWLVNVERVNWAPGAMPFAINVSGRIVAADFNDQLDLRLAENKKSINRLLEHLKHHCPALLGTGGCDWEGKDGTR